MTNKEAAEQLRKAVEKVKPKLIQGLTTMDYLVEAMERAIEVLEATEGTLLDKEADNETN